MKALVFVVALFWASISYAQDLVIESGGGDFHIFRQLAGADSTYLVPLFDFDGDGDLDAVRIVKLGIKSEAGATDSLWVHTNNSWHAMPYPPNSDDAIPIKGRKLSLINSHPVAAAADGAVFKFRNSSVADVYIYVWVE